MNDTDWSDFFHCIEELIESLFADRPVSAHGFDANSDVNVYAFFKDVFHTLSKIPFLVKRSCSVFFVCFEMLSISLKIPGTICSEVLSNGLGIFESSFPVSK